MICDGFCPLIGLLTGMRPGPPRRPCQPNYSWTSCVPVLPHGISFILQCVLIAWLPVDIPPINKTLGIQTCIRLMDRSLYSYSEIKVYAFCRKSPFLCSESKYFCVWSHCQLKNTHTTMAFCLGPHRFGNVSFSCTCSDFQWTSVTVPAQSTIIQPPHPYRHPISSHTEIEIHQKRGSVIPVSILLLTPV